MNDITEKYHRFLHGGKPKNGILSDQLHFIPLKKAIFRYDFEVLKINLRRQSLPEMSGVPGVHTFSFSLPFPGEKQANILIILEGDKICCVSWDTPKEMFSFLSFQKVFLHVTSHSNMKFQNLIYSNGSWRRIKDIFDFSITWSAWERSEKKTHEDIPWLESPLRMWLARIALSTG